MEHVDALVRWTITYSVSGGFWHFIACCIVISCLCGIFGFVRVNLTIKRKSKAKS